MVSVKRKKASWPRLRADKGESWSARMGSTDATAPSAWPAVLGPPVRGWQLSPARARGDRCVRLSGDCD
jgi:hypothetical protein